MKKTDRRIFLALGAIFASGMIGFIVRYCEPGELCILRRTGSNAFTDPRGNKFLESMCTNEGRGPTLEQRRAEIDVPEPILGPVHPLPDSDIDELIRVFRNGIGKDLRE